MSIFRRPGTQDIALNAAITAASAIHPDDIRPESRDILTRNIDNIERALDAAKGHSERLAVQLANISEELRQTRVSVEAFELAHGKMVEGRTNG